MKTIVKTVLSLSVMAVAGLWVNVAMAMTPTLNVYNTVGNDVQLTVNGDANAQITLYYTNPGSTQNTINSLGYTNSNGYFSTTIGSGYNIYQNASVYVTVNGQQSQTINWPGGGYTGCSYYGCYNNSIWLSQSNVYVNRGQSVTVTVNGGGNGYYISSNQNNNIATANISGNTITVYGNSAGSVNFSICSNYSNSGCVNLYVTVDGYYNGYDNYDDITFSTNDVAMSVGENRNVVVYTSGNFYLSNNSNNGVVDVTVGGGNVHLYGRNPGTANLLFCRSSYNYNNNNCSTLTVTVNNYNTPYIPGYPNYVYPTVISLAQVPYTGIGSGTKVALFMVGMMVWTAGLSYLIIRRKARLA